MDIYFQTLLGATAADPENSKTAFEILSSTERSDLDGWIGVDPKSEARAPISRSTKLRIQLVDPNIGSIE